MKNSILPQGSEVRLGGGNRPSLSRPRRRTTRSGRPLVTAWKPGRALAAVERVQAATAFGVLWGHLAFVLSASRWEIRGVGSGRDISSPNESTWFLFGVHYAPWCPEMPVLMGTRKRAEHSSCQAAGTRWARAEHRELNKRRPRMRCPLLGVPARPASA